MLDALRAGRFSPREPGRHAWVYDKLLAPREQYLHLADMTSYTQAHDAIAALYREAAAWTTRAILNVARSGKFSSDRTIREYARDIWKIEPA